MTLSDLVEQYLSWKGVSSGSDDTLRSYRKDLEKLLAVGAQVRLASPSALTLFAPAI